MIQAVKLSIDCFKKSDISEKVSLSCKKKIVGNVYFGAVDYSIVVDCIDIILTMAPELDAGEMQNLVQQRCSKEFLAKVAVDPTIHGTKRKPEVESNLEKLKPINTFGIATDGTHWSFMKTCYDSTRGKNHFIRSFRYCSYDVRYIKELISRIIGIIFQQLNEIRNSTSYKAFKQYPTEALLACEISTGNEVMPNAYPKVRYLHEELEQDDDDESEQDENNSVEN